MGTQAGCSSPFLRPLSLLVDIPQSLDAQPVRRQTYGYLPGRTALPRGRYSFPVSVRVGG